MTQRVGVDPLRGRFRVATDKVQCQGHYALEMDGTPFDEPEASFEDEQETAWEAIARRDRSTSAPSEPEADSDNPGETSPVRW